jgi:uncharacterized protein YciI
MPRFVYFYFNRDAPDRLRPAVPAHVRYWQSAGLGEYAGGPFGDRSGGLIAFAVPDLQEAMRLVEQDPFVVEDLIAQKWVKEWAVE